MTDEYYRLHVRWTHGGSERLYIIAVWELRENYIHLVLEDRDVFIPFTAMESWWVERPPKEHDG